MPAETKQSKRGEMRPSGIRAVRELAWGTHLSQLYRTKQDLIDVLVPFFGAGLRANEQCLWVTCQPLPAVEARAALRKAVADVDERIAAGQLEIVDYDEWYLRSGELSADEALRGWLEREAAARARGFDGLRLTGNTFWLDSADWQSFAEYEAKVHRAFRGRRILALCSYSLDKCGPDEIMDVLRHHGLALLNGERGWEVLQSAALALAAVERQTEHAGDAEPALVDEEATACPAHASHAVRFFEEDAFPAGRIAQHLHEGLVKGEGAVVFATPEHAELLLDSLRALDVDVEGALARQTLVMADAEQVAQAAAVGLAPDPAVFATSVAERVRACVERCGSVRAYGEIVDVLALRGEPDRALQLEHWWNELLQEGSVSLLCGYSLRSFASAEAAASFRQLCEVHGKVEPIGGVEAGDHGRLHAELQQARAALREEVQQRRDAERARDRLAEAELVARGRAEAATDQLARLQGITAALSEVKTLPEIASVVASDVVRATGAVEAVVAVSDARGAWLTLLADGEPSGRPLQDDRRDNGFSADAALPLAVAFRSGFPLWLQDREAIARYPAAARAYPKAGSIACVPVVLAGERLGAMQLVFSVASKHGPRERALVEDFARQLAVAVDRAHTYERVQRERSRAEQEQRRAEDASRAKDEFVAVLSHELRNPLSPILTAVQLMRLRGGDVLAKERAMIERQVNHMVRLVDDLMDVSRIARGKLDLKREPIELAAAVADALEIASPLLEQRAHDLVTEVPSDGLLVAADPDRLRQIIVNLLTNAAKYTPARGLVRLTGEARDGTVTLHVRDTGVGIDADLLPRVFDTFAQGTQGSDRAAGGLGLGLSIARSLAEMHGGTLRAQSAGHGHGSTFTLELPLVDEVSVGVPRLEPLIAARAVSGGLRVLIVDDNVDAALTLAAALEALGHAPGVAHDGPAALRVAAELRPELALLDIGLPLMDGYELAARLAQLLGPECPRLVAISGYGQESDRKRSQDAGFVEHLVKPADLERVAAVIARCVPDQACERVGDAAE